VRVVQLNPFYFPYAGGIERRIRAVGRRLAAWGHEVHVVTAAQPGSVPGTTEEDGMQVHRLPSSFPLRRFYNPPPVVTKGLGQAIRDIRPDVVDLHFRWSPSYSKAFRELDCPGVLTYHNTYGEGRGLLGLASRANDRMFMRTLRHARRVLCVSDFLRRDLEAHGGPADKLRVSHNAVEPQPDGPAAQRPKPYAIAVGRVVRVKGLDTLVAAWPDVPRDLELLVAGQGPARKRLEAQARRLGVADRVRFLGWIQEAEKDALLRGAVAYVHPARYEAFGISILEAMACGAPVVAADAGGIPEVVGAAGPVLPHEPRRWAEAITRLATDPAARSRASAASRAQAARFDWDAIARGVLAAYEDAARPAAMRR
jgi:glycosyltransferase involved in cell wall biosynthesis